MLAYAVAGIFGRGRPRPVSVKDAANGAAAAGGGEVARGSVHASRAGKRAGSSKRRRSGKAKAEDADKPGGGGKAGVVFGGNDDDDDEALPPGFQFDWDAYRAAFGETLIEDAVTIMFAEYAALYARIAGWTTSAAPSPMSLEEGEAIKQQASNFVLNIMSPILGYVHTSKVHKLLAHTMDSIRYHGHLKQGNTSSNEAAHKVDKKFYRRTNMAIETFTEQLVRQAQGAREVGRRNDAADANARPAFPLVPPLPGRCTTRAATGLVGVAGAASDGVTPSMGGQTAGGGGNVGPPSVSVAAKPRRRSPDYLKRQSIRTLSQRPGLSDLGVLFDLPPDRNVPVLSTVEFSAVFNCGTRSRQLLRAAPQFRDARPWYDCILFSVAPPANDTGTADGGVSDGTDAGDQGDGGGGDIAGSGINVPQEVLYVGEVRAIIRCKQDDYAVVCQMTAVDAVPGCPFASRDCDRLKWAVSSNGGHVIRAVPLSSVRRLLHVVPDFKDLATRKGLEVAPAGYQAPLADQQAMHYFVNEFYPWA